MPTAPARSSAAASRRRAGDSRRTSTVRSTRRRRERGRSPVAPGACRAGAVRRSGAAPAVSVSVAMVAVVAVVAGAALGHFHVIEDGAEDPRTHRAEKLECPVRGDATGPTVPQDEDHALKPWREDHSVADADQGGGNEGGE